MIHNRELSLAEQMLNYMNDKYQENFTSGLFTAAGWAYDYDSMTVYSEKFPGEYIQVYRYKENDFRDNYLSFLFREEIEARVAEIARPLFGKCKAFMHLSSLPIKGYLTKEVSMSDYLSNCPCDQGIYLYLENYSKSLNYKEELETLRLQFKNLQLPHAISLLFLKPEKKLEEITRETESMILNKIGDNSWIIKRVNICCMDNYDFDEAEQGQI